MRNPWSSATNSPSGCTSQTSECHPEERPRSDALDPCPISATLATCGGSALHPRRCIETNGCGHRKVQRLRLAIDRDPHDRVAGFPDAWFEAPCLVSHHPGVRSGQVDIGQL